MGTQGRSGLDRVIFGSTAEKVVRNSDRPVLTVKNQKGK
jgi:nucleotide-binding universal stress UspA family protein